MKCHGIHQPFTQTDQTIISVSPALRASICNVPTITVFHRRPDGTYEQANVSVRLKGMPLNKIEINHGGVATGYVKIQ